MKKLKLATVVGTRPELIKLSEVIKKADLFFEHTFVHTGQNYDVNLNDIFYEDLCLRRPDVYLGVVGKNLGQTMGNVIEKSYGYFTENMPDAVLILGDTNSALSAISAKRLKIPIFHMEAGNRCFDENLPEEINRRMIDHISDVNLPYSEHARRNLLQEGLKAEYTFVTGSPMREVLTAHMEKIENSKVLSALGLDKGKYIMLSAHREENIDNEKTFFSLMDAVNAMAEEYQMPVIYSVHPRSAKFIKKRGFHFHDMVRPMPPFSFTDYVKLERNAFCVVSDSGTLAEEASICGFPAVSIRTSTERPEALEKAAFIIGGITEETVLRAVPAAVGKKSISEKAQDYRDENISDKVIGLIQGYTEIVNRNIWRKVFMTEKRKRVVVYGAGAMASHAIKKLSSDFYDIIAVCDSDESKAGMNICGIPVMNQQMVREKYGDDFFVYVSPNSPVQEEIQAQIIRESFVTRERIINYIYLSCNSLENVAIVENKGMFLCCNLEGIRNAAPCVPWKSSEYETVNSFIKQRDAYIENLQQPHAKGPCDGCPDLCMAQWNPDRRVNILALSLYYPCQLSCIYCDLPTNGKNFPNREEELKRANSIDVRKLLDTLKENGKLQPSEPVQISGGEITVSPKKEELLNAVSEYPLQIFTNGILFDEKIAELTARNDGSFLNISLDAGTRETYCLVKGLDVYGKVCETLMKYRHKGSHILLKYIILPENCSRDNFDGFVTLAKKIAPISVSISCDIRIQAEKIPKSIVEGAIYLGVLLKHSGIRVNVLPYFGKNNLDYIHLKMKKEEVVL